MLDISVIILTYNEELHIRRCIENVMPIAKNIFIVDSFSTDRTIEIATELGAIVYQNKWENNYAKQFNWGLVNLPIDTTWVLRLDADEYLTPALIDELRGSSDLPHTVTGIITNRRYIFLNRWIKKGTYPVKVLRIFKYGKAICEQRLMDEHIQLLEGETCEFKNDLVDENLNDLTWWSSKHNGYAIREAIDLLDIELGILGHSAEDSLKNIGKQASSKRGLKHKYALSPLFLRSFLYFCYRYFFKLGFLEGKEGFLWHFLQGWWYRTLVDAKIYEIKKQCGNDKEKIVAYIQTNYKIALK